MWSAGGIEVDGYAYNGQVPGPTLRLNVGDTLVVDLDNQLETPTTIHWHGVEVPWEMDGALWMQAPVEPGASFQYRFTVNRPGTFWYHPHFDTHRQVDAGLYGALIVEDPNEPSVDEELVLLVDDIGETDVNGEPLPRVRPRWIVNGLLSPRLERALPSTVRARLINVSNRGYLSLSGDLRQIAGDQGLIGTLSTVDNLLLAPGDRAELEILVGGEPQTFEAVAFSAAGPGVDRSQVLFDVVGPASVPMEAGFGGGGMPPTSATISEFLYVFSGDESTGEWRINGEAFPDITPYEIDVGTPVEVTVRNSSTRRHPFHAHGMRFEVLEVGGVPPDIQMVEDTIDVPVQTDVRLRLLPEHPGEWMVHCHLLEHAEGGMMTVLRVRP